jgi:hypothetical protein
VGLAQDPLVEDANVADHQQPQVRHDEVAEVAAGDVIALDVEPEALAPERPAVGEVELEVEFDAVLIGFRGSSRMGCLRRSSSASAIVSQRNRLRDPSSSCALLPRSRARKPRRAAARNAVDRKTRS